MSKTATEVTRLMHGTVDLA